MHIRLEKDSTRRFAYTDRKNGYLELMGSLAATGTGGYFRGNRKYLTDFFIVMDCGPLNSGNTDLWRTNARYTDVKPDEFEAVFDHGPVKLSLAISLLLDEQAFCVSIRESFSDIPVGTGMQISSRRGAGILFAPGISSQWQKSVQNGITCYCDPSGAVVASASDFQLETIGEDRVVLSSEAGNALWYVVFGESCDAARHKAMRLVLTKAIEAHRKKIADFFFGFHSDSGDSFFDEALKWAQFSGWMLVTDDSALSGPGMWAGLPWFRDNWGRDTCVAMTGILLVSGRFTEAKSVLLSFALCQDKNPNSPDYGRLPNRYRGDGDAIYNAADSTLWFIRALWEYLQYTGDFAILIELESTLDLALHADIERRMDGHGFLLHGDADTWMDARLDGKIALSPRGDRACEIQALWYTALCVGSRVARLLGKTDSALEREILARRVKESFGKFFWCDDRGALADRLPSTSRGELIPDFRVRPNQLFAITAPSILADAGDPDGTVPESGDSFLLSREKRARILENVSRELLSPFGLFSLCPDDPAFHPHHENSDLYHKDAAYHNGTIWVWNTGAYISAMNVGEKGNLAPASAALLQNEATLIIAHGCVGTLSENIHAEIGSDGKPILSGTWSQAWSVSEFSRNVYQDVIGFIPRLAENRIELRPHLPAGVTRWKAEARFGDGWHMDIDLERIGSRLRCSLLLSIKGASRHAEASLPTLTVNGIPIEKGTALTVFFPLPEKEDCVPLPFVFPRRDLAPDWCGATHHKKYLENLARDNRLHSLNGSDTRTAELEWFFESGYFRKKYRSDMPLGALWSSAMTVFRLWAPTARSVRLCLYPDGDSSPSSMIVAMKPGSLWNGNAGVWEIPVAGDQSGVYYRFCVHEHGVIRESADPYARSCGINGKRSMVVDPKKTNPDGWDSIRAPALTSANDAIVYEVHVADISSSSFWNGDPSHRHLFLGAAEGGTDFNGVCTGFDHIKNLGVTHVQLLPVFDFSSVDENRRDDEYRERTAHGAFNWGYDPENFSSPEGSYSTDPHDGHARMRELKILVASFISAGIGVIMDVVYNHVPGAQNHSLSLCVPGYYFRRENFSGAGDDTASEREMFRAYMIDSLSFWLSEYKLSGFRFDLMGLHDVETMNAIAHALRNIKSDVLLYGEGWDMYRGNKMIGASMVRARSLDGIGFFNDAFRSAVKGSSFHARDGGFLHDGSHRESLKFGLVGSVYHGHVHNRWVDGTVNPNPWTSVTGTSVNYAEIHDNATLYDKNLLVEENESETYYERLQKTALSLILLAQGQPVLHAGMEFLRTKEIPADILASTPNLQDLYWGYNGTRAFSHNSYNLCDRINGLDWKRCAEKRHIVEYVRRLIAVRRAHPLFRLRTATEVSSCMSFIDVPSPGTGIPTPLVWTIDGRPSLDKWKSVCVIVNPSREPVEIIMPAMPSLAQGKKEWNLITDGVCFADVSESATSSCSSEVSSVLPGSHVVVAGKALYLYAEF